MFAERGILCMIARKEVVERKVSSPRKRRQKRRQGERERGGVDLFVACAPGKCLPARMSRRKGRAHAITTRVSRDGFNCFDHIQWEKVWRKSACGKCRTIDRVEGGFRKDRDKLHGFGELGIDCLSNRYRTVAQSNPS